MPGADLYAQFTRQLEIVESEYEETVHRLFEEPLSAEQFALRRAYVRELEACLGGMHETRRAMRHLKFS